MSEHIPTQSIVVLYHANCADGFCAALAAWLKFGDSASYFPVQYGEPIPDGALANPGGSDLYILDFSYARGTLTTLASEFRSVLVLDHHASAEKELEGLPFCRFEKNKSGAVMAWEYFFPGKPWPLLFAYVQDRDLWEWKLPGSRAVSAYLQTVPFDFKEWQEVMAFSTDYGRIVSQGAAILTYQQQRVHSLAKKAGRIWLCRGEQRVEIPAVNSAVWQSEIGEELLDLHPEAPAACVFFQVESGEWVYSLRARKGQYDVSELAKAYGGGGHAPAAGFRHSLPPCTQDVIDCLKFPHDDAILLLPAAV